MGEVYQARDTRLGRDVALKILPDLFAKDDDRLARFEREARALAALNHPNIAQLYGVEESSGRRALVMEFVPGRTLEQILATREPMAADEAAAAVVAHLDIGRFQIAVDDAAVVRGFEHGVVAPPAEALSPARSEEAAARHR